MSILWYWNCLLCSNMFCFSCQKFSLVVRPISNYLGVLSLTSTCWKGRPAGEATFLFLSSGSRMPNSLSDKKVVTSARGQFIKKLLIWGQKRMLTWAIISIAVIFLWLKLIDLLDFVPCTQNNGFGCLYFDPSKLVASQLFEIEVAISFSVQRHTLVINNCGLKCE